ncbi:DUF882 domain-containing protein [Jiella endophytica]|uniref:DUF882 domain-containing protein n=1 Tax=Jiella endophytica TaxID=2558362 RepID=UPI001981916D|nr:DUF882 domain-containing protein [Jiella endophytica]
MFGRTVGAGRFASRLAAMAAAALLVGTFASGASAETRSLRLYNLHTKEKAVFAYKVNGRYDQSELKKVNWFLRDWRKAKATTMDPRLLDLIWEAYRQSGSNGYINVICGYRSPATNEMLRSRSSGVAKKSQHTLGRALDFYIPDVPLKKMREIGLKMQVGGVGYYPRSGSPFVHFDVGNARHWPRMSRRELLAVFPNGGTVHVPSDGKPLPGYSQALASYKSRRSQSEIQVANAGRSSSGGGKSLIAMLFGGGDAAEEAEDEADVATPAEAPARAAPAQDSVQVAAIVPQPRPSRDLPSGVSVPVADTFDTGAPAAADTKVAAIEPSRVPLPTFASRGASQTAQSSDVGALIAAMEETSPEPALASGQLAYSVPTPTDRPNFKAVLNGGAKVEQQRDAVAALGALATGKKNEIAAVLPQQRPGAGANAKSENGKTRGLIAASFREPSQPKRERNLKPQAPAEAIETAAAEADSIEAEILAGKGGRVVRPALVASRGGDSQASISSRIAFAARASASRAGSGNDAGHAGSDLGKALLAKGFTLTEVRHAD